MENQKNIEFNGILISHDESMTVGNCIDLGFGTEKTRKIIEIMRSYGLHYLTRKELEMYRNI